CNPTLPVACVGKTAANAAGKSGDAQFEFEYSKYSGWPEIKESLMAGRIPAAFMLAPLVMDLADKRIPVKIVALGHRSGAVIMVRSDSPCRHFEQLTGRRFNAFVAFPAPNRCPLRRERLYQAAEKVCFEAVFLDVCAAETRIDVF